MGITMSGKRCVHQNFLHVMNVMSGLSEEKIPFNLLF